MTVKLLTEYHLEFLSLKGGCTGSSESTLAKTSHCWKSRLNYIIKMLQSRSSVSDIVNVYMIEDCYVTVLF